MCKYSYLCLAYGSIIKLENVWEDKIVGQFRLAMRRTREVSFV